MANGYGRWSIAGDHGAVDTLGSLGCPRHGEAHGLRLGPIGVDVFEDGAPLPDVEIVGIGVVVETLAVSRSADVDDAAGIGDADGGSEEQRVRDREDRRVRADADGDRHRGRHREERIPPQEPQGVPDILRNAVEHILLNVSAPDWLTLLTVNACRLPSVVEEARRGFHERRLDLFPVLLRHD